MMDSLIFLIPPVPDFTLLLQVFDWHGGIVSHKIRQSLLIDNQVLYAS
jgi:hypothetical protein